MPVRDRYDFASDNTAAICPEVWTALTQANEEAVASYGKDRWTARVCDQVDEIFEKECETFFVFNGTGANSLALAQLCRPFHSILCHEHSHVATDECSAPEFFSGGSKLLPVAGPNGKIDLSVARDILAQQGELHSPKPRAISVTQATELGTVYTPHEIGAVADFAKKYNLCVHMDGARFANAVASLGCTPKEITWERGVDVLSFGGTKNGLAVGELVVFFDRALAREFDYRAKQGSQLASKMRFISAPWSALLADDVWLKNARHANECAQKLAAELDAEPAFPREGSALFLRLTDAKFVRLQERGWHFYKFIEPDVYRLMCSWSTTEKDIAEFVGDVRQI
jgi:threonine aldolase